MFSFQFSCFRAGRQGRTFRLNLPELPCSPPFGGPYAESRSISLECSVVPFSIERVFLFHCLRSLIAPPSYSIKGNFFCSREKVKDSYAPKPSNESFVLNHNSRPAPQGHLPSGQKYADTLTFWLFLFFFFSLFSLFFVGERREPRISPRWSDITRLRGGRLLMNSPPVDFPPFGLR